MQSTVVDLMVYALANATQTTCIVLSSRDGEVRTTRIEPREGIDANHTIHVCKFGPHYDAVLDLSTPPDNTKWWTVARPFGRSHAPCNSPGFSLKTENRFLPLADLKDSEKCHPVSSHVGEEDDPIIIASSTSDDNCSGESISTDHQVSCSPTYSDSPAHEQPQHAVSIVLSSSDEDGSQVTSTNDLQILTESSSNDSENLPDTGLASDTCGHKQKAKTWTPHGTPQPIDATQLPFNIDGNVVYTLPYNNAKRMKSSLDGRPWKTWVTVTERVCRDTPQCTLQRKL